MANDDMKPDTAKVAALYFNAIGNGPDHVYLEVFPIRGDDVMPASLALRVRAGDDLTVYAALGGGYFMHRHQIEELHRALGAWLADVK